MTASQDLDARDWLSGDFGAGTLDVLNRGVGGSIRHAKADVGGRIDRLAVLGDDDGFWPLTLVIGRLGDAEANVADNQR